MNMGISVLFEIAALVNSIIILYAFVIHKKLPDAKTLAFLFLTIVLLVVIVANLATTYAFAHPDLFSIKLLAIINSCYIFSAVVLAFSFCIFSLAYTQEQLKINKVPFLLFVGIPFIVQVVLILLIPVHNIIFEIDENKVYSRTTGCLILQGIAFVHVFYGFLHVCLSAKTIPKQNRWFYYSFLFISLLGLTIQIFVQNILLQDYAISLSILLILFSLHEKDVITSGSTGLLNHKAFNAYTSSLFKKKAKFCVISLFVDDLSFLISTFGINRISSMLGQVADYLKTVAYEFKIFQLTNDNFCVVVPNIETRNYATLANKLRDRFDQSWKTDLAEIKLNARLCIIRCPRDAENTETVLDAIRTVIDDPRYKSKELLFADNIDVNTKKRYAFIEQLVRTSIQEGRIEVYYQPLYSINEKRIIGAEALVRMRDHDGNFISPDEFVPIAEQTGQILRIGSFVYEEVCKFISTSHLQELGIRMIDVNLSVAQCMQTQICEELIKILEPYRIDPGMINLEITETAAAHNMELLFATMNKLNSMGFSCSLDDYGTGYANLNYILHMAFSMIKIDKDIVWNAMKDVRAYVLLVGIIDLMHKLDMKIVAEGIETQEMVDKLTELKCDYLQGYFYARPLPKEEFFEVVKTQAVERGLLTKPLEEIFPETYSDGQEKQAEIDVGQIESFEELENIEELEDVEELLEVEDVELVSENTRSN